MIFCSLLNYSLIFSFLSTKLGKCTPIVPCYSDLFHSEGSTLDQLVRVERTKWVERKGSRYNFSFWLGEWAVSVNDFVSVCVSVCMFVCVCVCGFARITRPFMDGFGWNFHRWWVLLTSLGVSLTFLIKLFFLSLFTFYSFFSPLLSIWHMFLTL